MEQTVFAYYHAILRRDPSSVELNTWRNILDNATDIADALDDLALALCSQADDVLSVMRIYQVVLGRVPDSGGLDFWVQVFRDMQEANPGLSYGDALVASIRDWLTSPEFTTTYGNNPTDEEFVALLYINVLGRQPDQAGFDFWVNELANGIITREQLVIAFSEAVEFKMQVDAEAKGILVYDAQVSSSVDNDDPHYEIPDHNPYGGELQNEAPVGILAGTDIDENAANGTPVNDGELTAVDPDGGEVFTWEMVDDAGGAFALDDPNAQRPTIIVADGSLLDHAANPTMTVRIRVTDRVGNSHERDVEITVNQAGEIIRFTESVYEILEGTGGNDQFIAAAGVGIDGPTPGESQTANSGDIADGGAGHDTFELIKFDNNVSDHSTIVDGVALRNIETISITSLDRGPVIFDAALSPDIDQVTFDGSTESAGIWNLQADFWTVDPSDPADAGPVVNIIDTYGDFVWIDSDAQARQAESASDALRLNLNNSWITELRITENATSGQPGGPQSEQIGTINIHAQGTPSGIGSLVNGWPGGELFPGSPINVEQFYQPTTHTLNLYADDLTGTRPDNGIGTALEAIDLQAFDLFVGQASPIGTGLTGLETINVIGNGDVLLTFASIANDTDDDGNGYPLEVVDGSGNGLFFFHEDGFVSSRLDAGGGSDLVAIYTKDLDGRGQISNVERLLVADAPGEPGRTHINLGAVQDSLEEVIFHGGVTGDLRIVSIPTSQANPRTRLTFDQEVDLNGSLPLDFDLFLATENAGTGIDAVFRVDPAAGGTQRIDNFNTRDIETLRLHVEDSDAGSAGRFLVGHLASQNFSLETLLLTDDGTAGTTLILNRDLQYDDATATGSFTEANPLARANSASIKLDKIDGTGGVRHQEFLAFAGHQIANRKFLPLMEEWSSDVGHFRPVANGRHSEAANIDGALVVSDDGMTADLGEGDDIITGNRHTATGTGDRLGTDLIRGNGGSDLIFGAFGNDQIEGGSGFDELQGEAGDDRIWGDSGDDLILAGFGDDYADGGSDHDVIFGEEGNDVLRGSSGDDAISGDEGDDDLIGDGGSDFLIGGRGDDFLDAGHDGNDHLMGDYGSEGRAVTLTIPSDMKSWDEFSIAIDWDDDQVTDFVATMIVEPYHSRADIADELVNQLLSNLGSQSAEVHACFDIYSIGNDITIQTMAEHAPLVEFSGLKDAFAPVHKSELGGAVGNGDTFTWDVTWSGGSNIRYSYEYDALNPGDNVRQVLSSDGLVDTAEERLALAADIVAHFEFHRPAEMAISGFWMKLDEQGNICLNGPGNLDILLRLNWPEFSVGTESIYRSALSSRSLHFVGMNDAKISITLSEEERTALEAVCRRRKVEALVWKRARAFLLLDAGEDARTVCRILDIGPTVLTEWKSAFAAMGLSFFGLKDYSPRQGHLSFAQEAELKAHFSNTPPRNADEVCAHILAEYGQSYCSSGAAKLMSRLGFEYRKPQVLPTRAAEAAQEAFIAAYEALMRRLDDDEMVVFSDAVHPTHQSRPAHGWFPKDQKTAIKASSGRKRLNIQGAIDLETFQFTFVEAEKINARTTRQMLEKLELANPSMTAIHVFVDNARYHHAKVLQPWLNAPDRRVKLHFLPPYAPHLNPIERLWGVMHKWVTHNRHYATFNQFADAIMGFFRQTLPDKWHEFRDTVTDNFRVISLRKYKLI